MKALNKKGALEQVSSTIMGIVVATVFLTVGLIVVAELKNTSTSTAANTSISTIETKLGTIPNWIGILIVVAMSAIVLGYFYVRGQSN